jgi:ABC-2 type transport system ATP-binding protein
MSVLQNLEFFSRLGGSRQPFDRNAARNALRAVGIPERAFDVDLGSLNRETEMLVSFAVAKLRDTPVIVADEPAAGLDSRAAAHLQEQLLEQKEQDKAILIATADVLMASQVADRIAIIKRGKKVAERTRAQVLGLSLAELYLDYVGRPPNRFAFEARQFPTVPT